MPFSSPSVAKGMHTKTECKKKTVKAIRVELEPKMNKEEILFSHEMRIM